MLFFSKKKTLETYEEHAEIFDDNINKLRAKVDEDYKRSQVEDFVENMTLSEVAEMMPEELFAKTPKKRNELNKVLVEEILNGNIEIKSNGNIFYVNSDEILENNKDYYYENIKERVDNVKHFEPIVKQSVGIKVCTDIFQDYSIFDKTNQVEDISQSNEPSLKERIESIISLEPTKNRAIVFQSLLSEYNNASTEEKDKVGRKLASQLERKANKSRNAK